MASLKKPVPRTPLPPRAGTAGIYVTAADACAALGIKASTLYSYVSRGVIRSIVQPGQRSRLYYREDVERAGKRIGGRAGMPDTVEAVLSWGQPVFQTSIADLRDDGPIYRGRSALALAQSGRSFESVAELLWSGMDIAQLRAWDITPLPGEVRQRLNAALKGAQALTCLRIMAVTTTLIAVGGQRRPDFERGSTIPDARQLIQSYAGAYGLLGPKGAFVAPNEGEPLAAIFLRSMGATPTAAAVRAVNAALIICAEHELSPGSLAARVAASSGAELRACLLAAIATHSGTFLVGGCDQSEALLRQARSADEMYALMSSIERSGGRIPGYNLRVYPKGDPRARWLLALAESVSPKARRIHTLIDSVEARFDLMPSLEVGLVGLSEALDLPLRSASAIWSLARVAGWVAHVIEQRQAGFMVRPRARYVGPGPCG
ncbi:MAG: citrate/2-methylcitrate synthase [Lautropia sp.]